MLVGIYDRWLSTLGGGERMVAAIAEMYAVDNDVEILTHKPFELPSLARWFNLNLDRVRLRTVPDTSDDSAVRLATARYDLFFNASHLDYFPSLAKRSFLLVYFPATTLKHAAALGAYNRGKRHLHRVISAVLGSHTLPRVRVLAAGGRTRSSDQTLPGRIVLHALRQLSRRDGDNALRSYVGILTVSEFSQRWIRRYWGFDSHVLYPPISTPMVRPTVKRRQVLSVGRFFAGNHNKKQDVLIDAFRGKRGDALKEWELHLVGGFAPTESNFAFMEKVRDATCGDPSIHLHVNCDPDRLQKLYAESALFWHATGFEENAQVHPDRFEHFGITTVEAMSQGVVPLVFAGGGQPEVVTSAHIGILWTTIDDLIRESSRLAVDEERRKVMAQAAIARAADFDEEHFRARLLEIVE